MLDGGSFEGLANRMLASLVLNKAIKWLSQKYIYSD
jgi:hypothetical protein